MKVDNPGKTIFLLLDYTLILIKLILIKYDGCIF